MTHRETRNIAIADMKISKLNMRHGRKAPDISDILPSIREKGVYQSLLVRREGGKWGVVAGRRRLFALRKVAKETGRKVKAPCIIMKAGDKADAIEASILENIFRLPAGEVQQYDAFAALASAGQEVTAIAHTFGVTELYVRRILALSALRPDIKALYEADEIDAGTLRALTLANDDQQADWLNLFHDEDEYEPRGERLKAWLSGGARILTKIALFDVDTYDGVVIADLFGSSGVFADPDQFWKAQNAAIAERCETLKQKGWNDVVVMDRGERFLTWEHEPFSRDDGGKVFVETGHDGAVQCHEGYLTKSDAKKIKAILNGAVDEGEAAKSAKPEMSGPLADYIGLHRHAAVRAELTRHPKVALRFVIAHLIIGSALWRVDTEDQRTRKEKTAQSLAASEGGHRFAEARIGACALLGFDNAERGLIRRNGDEWALARVFKRLLDLDDDAVLSILAVAMGETLLAGTSLVEMLTYAIPVDMDALWQPDDAFFVLLRDKRVINEMVAEIASPTTAKAALTDTGNAQKAIIRNRIDGNGCDANTDWRPRWMQVPPQSYLDDKGCAPVEADRRISDVMKTTDTELSAA